jgi:hypothetical protein
MMKQNFTTKLLIIGFALVATNVMAQKARSLFDSGTGISIDSNTNAANEPAASPPAIPAPAAKAPGVGVPPVNQAAANKAADNANASPKPQAAKARDRYVGLSYSVLQEMSDGTLRKVSPDTNFKTGDRIKVQVMSNFSGKIMVANVGPRGDYNDIGEQQVIAKKPISVPEKGFLKFVGAPGKEQLMFLFAETDKASKEGLKNNSNPNMVAVVASCQKNPATRSLVVDDSVGNQYMVVNRDGSCGNQTGEAKTRSLVVDISEKAGYGVVPQQTLNNGNLLALLINLRHE